MVPAHRRQCAPPVLLQSWGAQPLTSSQVRLSGCPASWPGVPHPCGQLVKSGPSAGEWPGQQALLTGTVVPLFLQSAPTPTALARTGGGQGEDNVRAWVFSEQVLWPYGQGLALVSEWAVFSP